MVDAGEKVATTLRREFCEEAMDMLRADEGRREELLRKVDQWFAAGVEVLLSSFLSSPLSLLRVAVRLIALSRCFRILFLFFLSFYSHQCTILICLIQYSIESN